MLQNPRAPLYFGTIMILGFAAYLAWYYPTPGDLSQAHAQLEHLSVLKGCTECHSSTGLADGCLGCHEEIGSQLKSGKGLHHHLLSGKKIECSRCHQEHNGLHFGLTGPSAWEGKNQQDFQHPHVAFRLVGAHSELLCSDCHKVKGRKPFALSKFPAIWRAHTFLGLRQDCIDCHEDIHAGGFSPACDECHGQNVFRPATSFDHGKFYPLEGGHARVACEGCHILPEPTVPLSLSPGAEVPSSVPAAAVVSPFVPSRGAAQKAPDGKPFLPFDRVRGTFCINCHKTPHREGWSNDCEVCHPKDASPWGVGTKGVTRDVHAVTGFRLEAPHDNVECAKCHPPGVAFEKRYPDPQTTGYLRGEDNCQGCHHDVHGGQFIGKYPKCLDCHERHRFLPAHFGLQEHGVFPLTGAHAAVECRLCHKVEEGSSARKFAGVERVCKACHENPHGGQFSKELLAGDCDSCHKKSAETFLIQPFDHAVLAHFELTGAHAKASCKDCHHELELKPEGDATALVRVYRGTDTKCSACHSDPHRGQFAKDGQTLCESCHSSSSAWKEVSFDHQTQSRFPLDGAHSKVKCEGCHPTRKLPDGKTIVQYKPLGAECEDCHAFVGR